MTEALKRKLNSSAVEFVNKELDRRVDLYLTAAQIANAYVREHAKLIRESRINRDHLFRMIEYTVEIEYPQDAFLCSEFGEALEESAARLVEAEFDIDVVAPDDPVLNLRPSDLQRMAAAVDLRLEERKANHDRLHRINELLRPFRASVIPEPHTEECSRMLAAKYDQAVANHAPREHWMEELEFLIVPVRLIEPGLGTFEAFMRVLPRRLAVPRESLGQSN